MTFEAIALTKSPPMQHRTGFEKNPPSKDLFLKVEIRRHESELEQRQRKIMELYQYHMKLIQEQQEIEEDAVEGYISLECQETLDDH